MGLFQSQIKRFFLKENLLVVALLFLPAAITFWPILGQNTVSYNIFTNNLNLTRGINSLPVLDPAAGSFQDEPWLYYIGASWQKGQIPLINQANGLGAPFLTSLQSGALYPINIILALLPKESPQFFDIFSILHVFILLLGLYFLGCRFTKKYWIAAFIAGGIGASLAVVYNVNMVHFRAFVWCPWIAVSLIDIIQKPGRNLSGAVMFIFSILCSFTAGNPQQSILDFTAAIIVATTTLLRGSAYNRLWILVTAVFCGAVLASFSIIPYLTGIRLGDLWSVSDSSRSLLKISITMLLDMIIPRGTGYGGNLWFISNSSYDLQFAWPVAWIVGFLGGIIAIIRSRTFFWLIPLMLVIILFIAKLVGFGPWNWISHLPIINGIRFTKYTLFYIVLVLPVVVIGLTYLLEEVKKYPNLSIVLCLFMATIFALAAASYLRDESWLPNVNSKAVKLIFFYGIVSAFGAVVLPILINFNHIKANLLLWSAIMAFLLRPAGFLTEENYRQDTKFNFPRHLTANNFTDENWDRGISLSSAGFFVSDPQQLKLLGEGDRLIFGSGKTLSVQKIVGDQVWLASEEKLDPSKDGFPKNIYFTNEVIERFQKYNNEFSATWPRIVDSSYNPNTNLIIGRSSPWVFDPVMNSRYRNLMIKEFDVSNPFFNTKPASASKFTSRQIDVLRMLGVGLINGYQLVDNSFYIKVGTNEHLIKEGLLPEGLIIPEQSVSTLSKLFENCYYGDFVNHAMNVGTPCAISIDGPNSITVDVPPGSDSRRLLLNRVFMSGWKTSSSLSVPLADFWLSTPVGPAGGKIKIFYWPPGLSLGGILAMVGAIGLMLIFYLDYRTNRLHL